MDSLKGAFACAKAGRLKVKAFGAKESPLRSAYLALLFYLQPSAYLPELLQKKRGTGFEPVPLFAT